MPHIHDCEKRLKNNDCNSVSDMLLLGKYSSSYSNGEKTIWVLPSEWYSIKTVSTSIYSSQKSIKATVSSESELIIDLSSLIVIVKTPLWNDVRTICFRSTTSQ